jgi:hypothetical protein
MLGGAGVVMKLTNIKIKSAVAVAALTLAASPAFAQQQRERGRSSEGQRTEGRAVPRGNDNRRAEAPRQNQTPRAEAPRRSEAPRAEAPRPVTPRAEPPRAVAPRVENRGVQTAPAYRNDGRRDNDARRDNRGVVVAPRAVPRSQVIVPRGDRGVVGSRGYLPRVYAPRTYVRPYRSYGFRPYGYRPYVFRPYSRLSFGLYLGYTVPYSYVYSYPVPVYGYGAPSAPVYITPNSTMYGGITLEISPNDAQVFVDGEYVGQVSDFDGQNAPLNLTAGQHRIQLNAQGYEPMTMDVNVTPGQLVPYRGDLQPARY